MVSEANSGLVVNAIGASANVKMDQMVATEANSGLLVNEIGASVQTDQMVASTSSDQTGSVNTVGKVEFKVGEIVWARIKGSPHWPAQIKSFHSTKMVNVVWLNDYRRTRLYRTQMYKFLINFDAFAKRFHDTVGLETAAREGLMKYGENLGAEMRF